MNWVTNKRILIVDDNIDLLKMIGKILKKEGYSNIYYSASYKEGLELFLQVEPHIILLDINLPDGNGFSLFNEFKKHKDIPVIFLTARGEDHDKIIGLGMGADDYIVKPFIPKELVLRVSAVLRRTYSNSLIKEEKVFYTECAVVDLGNARVSRNGESLLLTAKEHSIITALYENANKIVTIDKLCEIAWEEESFGFEKTLMVHIRHIREKIESNPSKPKSLVTLKGLEYILNLKK